MELKLGLATVALHRTRPTKPVRENLECVGGDFLWYQTQSWFGIKLTPYLFITLFSEKVHEVVGATYKQIKSVLPKVFKKMSLYLANKDTEYILFRPIKVGNKSNMSFQRSSGKCHSILLTKTQSIYYSYVLPKVFWKMSLYLANKDTE